jgi:prepilin-type N-terminal cleavage/methylation domain-containing protein
MNNKDKKGFTLIELLVVIAIIGLIASIAFIAFGGVTKKARDTKRKAELSQIGRFIQASSCYVPDGGPGEYDLADLMNEFKIKYPQYASYISKVPKDPKSGSDTISNYKYILSADGSKCALIANLENVDELVTLPSLTEPTAGGGTGVLKALAPGWNSSDKYYQIGR